MGCVVLRQQKERRDHYAPTDEGDPRGTFPNGKTPPQRAENRDDLNSPESLIFSKKNNLYGLNVAKQGISKRDTVVLVEGYMDVISLHQRGIDYAVATLGILPLRHRFDTRMLT